MPAAPQRRFREEVAAPKIAWQLGKANLPNAIHAEQVENPGRDVSGLKSCSTFQPLPFEVSELLHFRMSGLKFKMPDSEDNDK